MSGKGDRLPVAGAGGLNASVLDMFFNGWADPIMPNGRGLSSATVLLLAGGAGLLLILRR